MLTFDQWLNLAKAAFVLMASILAFGKFMQRAESPRQSQLQGNQDHTDLITLISALDKRVVALERELAAPVLALDKRMAAVETIMERAGTEMSKLGSYVQGTELRSRDTFMAKEVCQFRMHESESDRQQIRAELERLRQGR